MTTKQIQPQDKYVLRLPDGMRDRIKAAADEAGRSMNAEIIRRLEDSFGTLPTQRELEAFVAAELSSESWSAPILNELRKPQPDIRRVVEFLDFLGVDAVSAVRRRDGDATSGQARS